MHLLKRMSEGGLSLVYVIADDNNPPPPYAILSHTWRDPVEEEVTYEDCTKGNMKKKPGYDKIEFCEKRAALDGLAYFWVDTCCIDKSSSAEVQEAIISMFKWYQWAKKCYVYLSDVSATYQPSRENWEQDFRKSRWFTRGWTLQELLAPKTVEFFSIEGNALGNKNDLEDLISEITQIPVEALQGTSLSQFKIDEKFSWAEGRETRRAEDEAYSLLGIFSIRMTVMYGEGSEAMARLKRKVYKADTEKHNWEIPQNHTIEASSISSANHTREWKILKILEGHQAAVWELAFSPDGKMLATGSWDFTIRLWDAQSGTEQHTLSGHTKDISTVVFSPDNKTLASGSEDCTIMLWDTQSGAIRRLLQGNKTAVWGVAFSPDGELLATGSANGTVMLWDMRWGAGRELPNGHNANVWGLVFSPDGKILATRSADFTVKLWDNVKLWDGEKELEPRTLEGHTGSIWDMAFSPDGKRLVTGSADSSAKLWHCESGTVIYTLKGHRSAIWSVAFSPDGSMLATGSKDCTARLWDSRSGALVGILEGHNGDIWSLAFSPDSKTLATGSADCTVRLWDGIFGAALQRLDGHEKTIWIVAFSPDGTKLATGSEDSTVRLWT